MACLGAMLCWKPVAPGLHGRVVRVKQFIDEGIIIRMQKLNAESVGVSLDSYCKILQGPWAKGWCLK